MRSRIKTLFVHFLAVMALVLYFSGGLNPIWWLVLFVVNILSNWASDFKADFLQKSEFGWKLALITITLTGVSLMIFLSGNILDFISNLVAVLPHIQFDLWTVPAVFMTYVPLANGLHAHQALDLRKKNERQNLAFSELQDEEYFEEGEVSREFALRK